MGNQAYMNRKGSVTESEHRQPAWRSKGEGGGEWDRRKQKQERYMIRQVYNRKQNHKQANGKQTGTERVSDWQSVPTVTSEVIKGLRGALLNAVGLEVLVRSHVNGLRLELMWLDVYWVMNLMAVPDLRERSLCCCLCVTRS